MIRKDLCFSLSISKKMKDDLQDVLEDYGLSAKEALLYLTTLEMGVGSISSIARRSGINRISIYPLSQKLIKAGILKEIERNGIKHISAISPKKLFKEMTNRQQKFKELMPEFIALTHTLAKPYKIQFFDGKQQVKKMFFDNTATWTDSKAQYDHTWRGFQDDGFIPTYSEWSYRYRDNMRSNERIHLLTNNGEQEKIIHAHYTSFTNRVTKYLPDGIDFNSTIIIAGDYIIMVMSREKHYAYLIEDKNFSHNLRSIFKFIREKSEPIIQH